MDNLVLMTDSYKVSHWRQYPKGTEHVYSYFESRGGDFKETVFFGLQYFIEKYLSNPISIEDIIEAADFYELHFGTREMFNLDGWMHILNEHDGYLPIRINAVPEGSVVPVSNVLMTVENTDPEVPWLTNWMETLLSQVWYPTTVATLSYHTKKLIKRFLDETGDPSLVDFKLHDFGFRGVSSVESSILGGMAHLVNFKGTDTVSALWAARKYYNEMIAGFSVPAAEHSTITSWGKENEVEAYRNMIQQFGDSPFYSIVSDSYDIYNAARNIFGEQLKSEILEANGTLVVRPDSGYPPVIVANVMKILAEKFGAEKNEKGYYVLNPKVRVIQGDGLDYPMINQVLETLKLNGFSADNITFGMGGGLLQKVNRDTQKFAFKCSDITINGEHRDVFKDPVTDKGKISKKGRLSLIIEDGRYKTVRGDNPNTLLQNVYENGIMTRYEPLAAVRKKAEV